MVPEAHVRRFLCALTVLAGLALLLGQTAPRPSPPAASAPAAKPADYYALTADTFFQLPETQVRLKKDAFDLSLLEAAVFHQTNRQRAANKLPLFKHGVALNLMARRHSAEMSDLQFFDHVSPNPATATLDKRLRSVGLVNVTAGENIAVLPAKEIGSGHYITHDPIDGNETWLDEATGKPVAYYTYKDLADAVVTQWMNSPAHHANIVNKAYVYLGVGIARGPYDDHKQDSFYMTQNFCATFTPASEDKAKLDLAAKPSTSQPARRTP
jgi:uncharacterized protein YkwD